MAARPATVSNCRYHTRYRRGGQRRQTRFRPVPPNARPWPGSGDRRPGKGGKPLAGLQRPAGGESSACCMPQAALTDSPGTVMVWKTQGRVENRGMRDASGRLNQAAGSLRSAGPSRRSGFTRKTARAAISRRRPVMPSHDRRAAGRRRAWGRGPIILKLESLERRALMAATLQLDAARPRELRADGFEQRLRLE